MDKVFLDNGGVILQEEDEISEEELSETFNPEVMSIEEFEKMERKSHGKD